MLRLRKLTLTGFKSSADTVDLAFGDGITGVVGPNGCGKSNVVDATAWVLGEQSAKSLRSARMSDVIFGGTARRPAMQMAEVLMALDRLDERGESVEEVEVARRVFRDGEAEYTLRGRRVRLQDVRDFLTGEGIPPNAYFIIEQGRVDEILSSRPEERRLLIEQAADIGSFKARRHQAGLKLQSAKENLARVEDIVRELDKRMRGLKVQAGRAQRHREIMENVRRTRRISYSRRWKQARDAHAEADRLWQARKEDDARLLARITAMETGRETLKLRVSEKRQELDNLRNEMERLTLELERGEIQLTHHDERLGELARRGEELESQQKTLASVLEERRASHASAKAELDAFAGEHDRTAREAAAAQERLDGLFRELEEIHASLEEREARRLEAAGEAARLRSEKQACAGNLRRLEEERARQEREIHEIMRERDRALAQRDALRSDAARLAESENEFARSAGEALARLNGLAEQKKALETMTVSLREGLAEVSLRKTLLEEEEARDTEPLKEIVTASQGRAADYLEVDAAWEKAAELLWGERLGALVFASEEAFKKASAALRARPAGASRVTLCLVSAGAPPVPPSFSAPTLRTHLRPKAGREGAAAGLPAQWPDALLADGIDEALRLQHRNPAMAVALRTGEVLLPGGVLCAGSPRGALTRRRETGDLERRGQSLQGEISAAGEKLTTCIGEMQSLERERAAADSGLQESARERASASGRLASAKETLRIWEERAGALRAASARLDAELAEARRLAAGIEETFTETGNLAARLDSERLGLEQRLAERRSEEDDLREKGIEVRERMASSRERLERLCAAEETLCRSLEESEEQHRRIAEERQAATSIRSRLTDESAALRERLKDAMAEKETKTAVLREGREVLDREQKQLDDADARLRAEREAYGRHRDALTESEVRRAELHGELQHLESRLREYFPGEAPHALFDALSAAEREAPLDALEQEMDEEEEKLRRLGAVNELAVEEFQEVEERWKFLTKERDDVLAAVASLEETIRELETTTSLRFEQAFQGIRTHFQALFAQLFEGGTGDLRLVPENDYLNGGVEIIAQPPGKKLQSIAQLSGGEKALSAIAFLFAIFEHSPAPFCVLDEVDAALDDANVERFGRLLQSRANRIQFLCITHNKRTMAKAHALYGVTMEEPGVTKFMSVRLGEASRAAAR